MSISYSKILSDMYNKRMDLHFYMNTHTKEQVERLCSLANTKSSWLSLCMRNHGRLGPHVAVELEAASRALAEYDGDYLTVEEIFNFSQTNLNFCAITSQYSFVII